MSCLADGSCRGRRAMRDCACFRQKCDFDAQRVCKRCDKPEEVEPHGYCLVVPIFALRKSKTPGEAL